MGSDWDGTSVYALFGVRPVINCCGIYTDLGGSVLSRFGLASGRRTQSRSYVRMTELLSSAGAMIASLVGAQERG